MSIDKLLQPGMGIVILIIILFVIYKIIKTGINILVKFILIPFLLIVAPAIWYFSGNRINSALMKVSPNNPELACIGLDENRCNIKSECEVVKFQNIGKLLPPMCRRK